MKQLTINQKNYLFVEVPEDANYFHLNESDKTVLMFLTNKYILHTLIPKLKNGNWTAPIKASEVTEEQWINIVEGRLNENLGTELFKNYMSSEYGEWFKTATGAGLSLIRSIGMYENKTVILTKK